MTYASWRPLLALVALAGCTTRPLAPAGGGPVPANHRPAPVACAPVKGDCSGALPDLGVNFGCLHDSDCTNGTNGHCDLVRGGPSPCVCAYDSCTSDSDCPANSVCVCASDNAGQSANSCIPGNCRVDADCGAGGYCSLSLGMGCIPRLPVQGYFCHTSADSCASNSDCMRNGSFGNCEWDPEVSHWSCVYPVCAG
jgi:hypothetical protein